MKYFVDLIVEKWYKIETKKEAVYDNGKRSVIRLDYVDSSRLGLEGKFFGYS